ncbi:MAG TPA: helix-turn-helix transcriptional regulator [Pseudogracilibacillus sp.]|nr:helix-turn-helix transcriptional regulator [Pseudogracilibacillus sp.]
MVKRNYISLNDPYVEMGKKLRLLRKYHHLTISDLAERLDLSDKIISNYENGYNRMTIETLVLIYDSEAFGQIDLEELLQIFILDIFE